jgi:hypothetical protein
MGKGAVAVREIEQASEDTASPSVNVKLAAMESLQLTIDCMRPRGALNFEFAKEHVSQLSMAEK